MRELAPISKKIGNFGENVPRRADLKNQHGEPALYGEPAPGVCIQITRNASGIKLCNSHVCHFMDRVDHK